MIRDAIVISAVSLLLAGCGGESPSGASLSLMEVSKQELADAVADRDSLLVLVGEITSGMEQIRSMENIMKSAGSRSGRNRILADMADVRAALQSRRERLSALERKLADTEIDTGELHGTIVSLRRQIDFQLKDIDNFRNELLRANECIEALSGEIDSLSSAVDSVSRDLDVLRDANAGLTNEINRCYFVIAGRQELKEHHVIETGFLRKTKLMGDEFDRQFFTVGDKRTINTIPLHSAKVKIYTNHPSDSYRLIDCGGEKTLDIISPDRFWSLTNYLVIQTD